MPKTSAEKSRSYRAKDIEGYRKKKAEWARTADQRKKRTEYMRSWRDRNRERHNELARKSYQRNKYKHIRRNVDYHLQNKYGISAANKAAMVEAQGGMCLICGEAFKSKRATHVDHCHMTLKIRGILCHVCNTKLGWFEKYRAKIVKYLGADANG